VQMRLSVSPVKPSTAWGCASPLTELVWDSDVRQTASTEQSQSVGKGQWQPQGRRTLLLAIASEKIGMDPVKREETTEKTPARCGAHQSATGPPQFLRSGGLYPIPHP
jgi:hypothetical protein